MYIVAGPSARGNSNFVIRVLAYNTPMNDIASPQPDTIAFPRLDANDLAALKPLATLCSYEDGQIIFRAGDADLDLFVVETGAIDILNPSDENRHVVTHTH